MTLGQRILHTQEFETCGALFREVFKFLVDEMSVNAADGGM